MLTRIIRYSNPLRTRISYLSTSSCSYSRIADAELVDKSKDQSYVSNNIKNSLNQLGNNRLFAVVFAHGRQYKVSQNDIIQLQLNSFLDVGEKIQLEKVLLVGGKDFTLFGRPMLNPEHVKVYATVIEKTTTSPELSYFKLSGKKVQKMRCKSCS